MMRSTVLNGGGKMVALCDVGYGLVGSLNAN